MRPTIAARTEAIIVQLEWETTVTGSRRKGGDFTAFACREQNKPHFNCEQGARRSEHRARRHAAAGLPTTGLQDHETTGQLDYETMGAKKRYVVNEEGVASP